MENFFTRYKNPLVLMAVLFIQVIALATQVKRPDTRAGNTGAGGTRLIRVWTVTAFTPFQKMFVSTGHFFRNGWHNYADLRGVRRQNEQLQQEIERLRMEQVRLRQDADQAHRLQALLEFKEKFVAKTLAAQVIATSGTEQSRVITIDKGSRDGLKPEMAVITPDGIVGKVKEVAPLSSQVLLINDRESGAGVILESSRLQGVLKGTSYGELQVTDIMSDEQVNAGEHVITSGGDRIFPKGLSVGTVVNASPDRDNDPFLNIRVKPSADLGRLEEVLVVTKTAEETPSTAAGSTPLRAADILSERLPSIPKPTPSPTPKTNQPGSGAQKKEGATAASGTKPSSASTEAAAKSGTPAGKPAGAAATATASPVSKTGTEAKKPASSTGNSSSTGAGSASASGPATPTPTPKPKAPAKKKAPAAPDATQSTPESKQPSGPSATPAPTPERSR
jgi:rod shape-determining protein MreC